jgi:hypothetical protein
MRIVNTHFSATICRYASMKIRILPTYCPVRTLRSAFYRHFKGQPADFGPRKSSYFTVFASPQRPFTHTHTHDPALNVHNGPMYNITNLNSANCQRKLTYTKRYAFGQ